MKASLDLLLTLIGMTLAPSRRLHVALAAGLAEEVLSVTLGVSAPFLLKRLLDRLTAGSLLEVSLLASGFALSWIAPSLFSALKLSHTARIVDGLFQEISRRVARRQLPRLAGVAAMDSAEVIGVLERLPFSLQLVIDGLVWRAAPLLLQAGLGLVAVAAALPLRYAAILGTALLIYLLAADLGAGGLSTRAERANQAAARLSATVADIFRGATRVVANGAVEVEVVGLGAAADVRRDANLDVAHRNATVTAVQFLVLGVGLTIMLIIAALDTRDHRLKVGEFVLLQALALRLALPLGGVAITVRQAGLAFATIRQALALAGPAPAGDLHLAQFTPDLPASPSDGAALKTWGVAFSYPGAAGTLQDITLILLPGEVIALVGANGSGKSTLARLMAGLLVPTQGAVLVGNLNCAALAPSERVRSVLYVPQFISLFNRSLGANALYPPSQVDPLTLADRLRAWRFFDIDRSVDLEAVVGEQGAQLSGGQIQKLELARLCDVPAPILILDESTSALDGPSETLVLRALRAERADRLLVIVTHRRSIAEAADRVVFLHQGRLAGLGSHAALMDLPAYRRLWDREA